MKEIEDYSLNEFNIPLNFGHLFQILDIASGVLVSQYRLIPLAMVILGVNILGFVFTGFIIVSTLSESKQRKFVSARFL